MISRFDFLDWVDIGLATATLVTVTLWPEWALLFGLSCAVALLLRVYQRNS